MKNTVSVPNIIEAIQPEVALFTTYSISLTAFEIFVLRHLLRSHCSEIVIVCDADRYRDTRHEIKSRSVGVDYRLIPFRRKGAFHGKTAFLANRERAVLIIGSGNLTYGGLLSNLEVLECFAKESGESRFNAVFNVYKNVTLKIFHEFGAAKSNPGLEYSCNRITSTLESFCSETVEASEPSLTHSLERPLLPQIFDSLGKLAEKGALKKMVVLSPFFGNEKTLTRELYEKLGLDEIGIVVEGSTSSFHFADLAPEVKVEPYRSRTVTGERNLHAKAYLWEGEEEIVTATGSPNFTKPALLTTDNFETLIIRRLKKDEAAEFLRTEKVKKPPNFKPEEWLAGRTMFNLDIPSATLMGNSLQVSVVLPKARTQEDLAKCTALIEVSSLNTATLTIEAADVTTDGERLYLKTELPEEISETVAALSCVVNLRLAGEDWSGFTWVENPTQLSMGHRFRRNIRAMTRKSIDDPYEDAYVYLDVLSYLTSNVERVIALLVSDIRDEKSYTAPPGKTKSREEARKISLAELDRLSRTSIYAVNFHELHGLEMGAAPFVFNIISNFKRSLITPPEGPETVVTGGFINTEGEGLLLPVIDPERKEPGKLSLSEKNRADEDIIDPMLYFLRTVSVDSARHLSTISDLSCIFLMAGVKLFTYTESAGGDVNNYVGKWLQAVTSSEDREESNVIKAFKRYNLKDIHPTSLTDFRRGVAGATAYLFYLKALEISSDETETDDNFVAFKPETLVNIWEDIMVNLYEERGLSLARTDVTAFLDRYLPRHFIDNLVSQPWSEHFSKEDLLNIWLPEIEAILPRRSELEVVFTPYLEFQNEVLKNPKVEYDTSQLPEIPKGLIDPKYFNLSKERLTRIIIKEKTGISKVATYADTCPWCHFKLAEVPQQRLRSFKSTICNNCSAVLIPWEGANG